MTRGHHQVARPGHRTKDGHRVGRARSHARLHDVGLPRRRGRGHPAKGALRRLDTARVLPYHVRSGAVAALPESGARNIIWEEGRRGSTELGGGESGWRWRAGGTGDEEGAAAVKCRWARGARLEAMAKRAHPGAHTPLSGLPAHLIRRFRICRRSRQAAGTPRGGTRWSLPSRREQRDAG